MTKGYPRTIENRATTDIKKSREKVDNKSIFSFDRTFIALKGYKRLWKKLSALLVDGIYCSMYAITGLKK